jgi:hypothetical protein
VVRQPTIDPALKRETSVKEGGQPWVRRSRGEREDSVVVLTGGRSGGDDTSPSSGEMREKMENLEKERGLGFNQE